MLPERGARRQIAPDQLSVGGRPFAAVHEHAAADLHPGGHLGRLGPKGARGSQIILGEPGTAGASQDQKRQIAPRGGGRLRAGDRPGHVVGVAGTLERTGRTGGEAKRQGKAQRNHRPIAIAADTNRLHWDAPRLIEQLLRFLLRGPVVLGGDRGDVVDQRRRRHRARQTPDRAKHVDAQLVRNVRTLDVLAQGVGDDPVLDGAVQLGDPRDHVGGGQRRHGTGHARIAHGQEREHPLCRLGLVARRQRFGGRGAHVRRGVTQPLQQDRRRPRVVDGAQRLDGAPPDVGRPVPAVELERVEGRLVGAQHVGRAQLPERVQHRLQPGRSRSRRQHFAQGLCRGRCSGSAQAGSRLDRSRVVRPDQREPQGLDPVRRPARVLRVRPCRLWPPCSCSCSCARRAERRPAARL